MREKDNTIWGSRTTPRWFIFFVPVFFYIQPHRIMQIECRVSIGDTWTADEINTTKMKKKKNSLRDHHRANKINVSRILKTSRCPDSEIFKWKRSNRFVLRLSDDTKANKKIFNKKIFVLLRLHQIIKRNSLLDKMRISLRSSPDSTRTIENRRFSIYSFQIELLDHVKRSFEKNDAFNKNNSALFIIKIGLKFF